MPAVAGRLVSSSLSFSPISQHSAASSAIKDVEVEVDGTACSPHDTTVEWFLGAGVSLGLLASMFGAFPSIFRAELLLPIFSLAVAFFFVAVATAGAGSFGRRQDKGSTEAEPGTADSSFAADTSFRAGAMAPFPSSCVGAFVNEASSDFFGGVMTFSFVGPLFFAWFFVAAAMATEAGAPGLDATLTFAESSVTRTEGNDGGAVAALRVDLTIRPDDVTRNSTPPPTRGGGSGRGGDLASAPSGDLDCRPELGVLATAAGGAVEADGEVGADRRGLPVPRVAGDLELRVVTDGDGAGVDWPALGSLEDVPLVTIGDCSTVASALLSLDKEEVVETLSPSGSPPLPPSSLMGGFFLSRAARLAAGVEGGLPLPLDSGAVFEGVEAIRLDAFATGSSFATAAVLAFFVFWAVVAAAPACLGVNLALVTLAASMALAAFFNFSQLGQNQWSVVGTDLRGGVRQKV